MRIKYLAIGAYLLVACSAFGQSNIHKVKAGENDNTIARKFNLSPNELHRLNPGTHWSRLRIGQKLVVEAGGRVSHSSHGSSKKHSSHHSSNALGAYRAKPGDSDWTVAKKFGTTPKTIRRMNPGIDWEALQIGHKLVVPGGGSLVAETSSKHVVRSRHAVIAGDSVNVRRTPRTSGEVIVQVDGGTKVTVLDREGDWYKLRFPKGTRGWVRGDFLKASKQTGYVAKRRGHRNRHSGYVAVAYAPRTGNAIIDKANTYRGVRYSYGSASRSGTDCSGLVYQVYRSAAGVHLPRTSREMSHVGVPVSKGQLKPGDMVFFKTNRGTRINHVGIYKGNGMFIHASSGRGHVTVSSLSEGYYSRRYAGARRVVRGKKK